MPFGTNWIGRILLTSLDQLSGHFLPRSAHRNSIGIGDHGDAQHVRTPFEPFINKPLDLLSFGVVPSLLIEPRNSDGNLDSPQAVVFLTSIIDVIEGL